MIGLEHKFKYIGKEVKISTDFDNGGLARVEEKKRNVFDIFPFSEDEYKDGFIKLKPFNSEDRDFDGANFSFHFMVEGCKNKKLTFRFHLKEKEKETDCSVVYANPDFPLYSYNGEDWSRMPNKSLSLDRKRKNWQIVTVEQIFKKDKVFLSYQYPYTNTHLADYIMKNQNSPFFRLEAGGYSTEGRIIPQINITDPQIPLSKKKVAWFTGLQHCAELGAGWGLEGMMDYLLSDERTAKKAR